MAPVYISNGGVAVITCKGSSYIVYLLFMDQIIEHYSLSKWNYMTASAHGY